MTKRTLVFVFCFAMLPSISYGQGGLFSGDGTALRILGGIGNALNNQGNQQPAFGQRPGFGQQQPGFGQQQPGFGQPNRLPQQSGIGPRHTTYRPGSYQSNGNGTYHNSTTNTTYVPNQGVYKSSGVYLPQGDGLYRNPRTGNTYRPDTGQYTTSHGGYIPPR